MDEKQQERELLTNNNKTTQQYPLQSNPPPAYQDLTISIKPIDYSKQDDYLVCSIINLVFCGICLGIPALIYSIKAREKYRFGRYQEAQDNARTAKKFNIAAFVIGSVCFIFAIVIHIIFFYFLNSFSYGRG